MCRIYSLIRSKEAVTPVGSIHLRFDREDDNNLSNQSQVRWGSDEIQTTLPPELPAAEGRLDGLGQHVCQTHL